MGAGALELRELSLDDVEAVKARMVEIFSGEPWNDHWEDPEQLHQYMLELMGNPNSLSFGLFRGGELIGICLGRIRHWYTGTEFWIDELGLVPGAQGAGVGREFLGRVETALKQRKLTGIVLITDRTMPAYGFYQKQGFEELKTQVLFAKELG